MIGYGQQDLFMSVHYNTVGFLDSGFHLSWLGQMPWWGLMPPQRALSHPLTRPRSRPQTRHGGACPDITIHLDLDARLFSGIWLFWGVRRDRIQLRSPSAFANSLISKNSWVLSFEHIWEKMAKLRYPKGQIAERSKSRSHNTLDLKILYFGLSITLFVSNIRVQTKVLSQTTTISISGIVMIS